MVLTVRRTAVAALAAAMLSGCIFFPPFGPGFGFSEIELTVENRSTTDLVVRFTGTDAYPIEFAVPGETTGTVLLLGEIAPTGVTLLTADCEQVGEVDLPEDARGVRIGADGESLEARTDTVASDRTLSEFFCEGGFGGPVELDTAAAAVSGGALAVGSADGYIWLIDLDAMIARQLTDDSSASDAEPAISPDWSQVAFTRYDSNGIGSAVWIVPAGGGEAMLVRDGAMTPVWSPDGALLAMADADPFGTGGLVIVEIDGGAETAIAGEPAVFLDWAPDGERLAYTAGGIGFDPFAPDDGGLYVATVGTGTAELLSELDAYSPVDWSPTSTMIAVETFSAMGDASVELIDGDTGDVVGNFGSEGYTGAPSWSPDGMLAYLAGDRFGTRTALMAVEAPDGEPFEVAEIADEHTYVSGPLVWSPDGAWIAFTRSTAAGASELWAVEVIGGEPVRLATGVWVVEDWR